MSLTATVAASPTSTISVHPHSHKKGVHPDSSTESSTTTSGQAPATTQGLFSSLLQSIEQVIGVPPLASSALKAVTAAAPNAATSTLTAASAGAANASGGHSSSSTGGIDARV